MNGPFAITWRISTMPRRCWIGSAPTVIKSEVTEGEEEGEEGVEGVEGEAAEGEAAEGAAAEGAEAKTETKTEDKPKGK